MHSLKLAEIAAHLQLDIQVNDIEITNVSTDTRTLTKGSLFVALAGDNFDGHNFLEEAVAKGAVAVVISKDINISNDNTVVLKVDDTLQAYGNIANLYRSKFKTKVAAITGSSGKTTTKNMLASILQQAGNTLVTEKNFNNEVGVPQTLFGLQLEHEFAVIEMGATKENDIAYLSDIAEPDAVVVTNAGPCHLATMGDMDGVARIKGELFANLKADGVAVVNVDDVYAPYWVSILSGQKVVTFGIESDADISCITASYNEDKDGINCKLMTDLGALEVQLPVVGEHNIYNALAATAVARGLGVELAAIKAGLESIKQVAGRLEFLPGMNDSVIINDSYNSNPASMQAAMNVLINHDRKNRVLVMGDMLELGEDEKTLHGMIGDIAQQLGVSQLYSVGKLAKHAADNFGDKAQHFASKEELVKQLQPMLDKDTVVLIKGSRGMALEHVATAISAEI